MGGLSAYPFSTRSRLGMTSKMESQFGRFTAVKQICLSKDLSLQGAPQAFANSAQICTSVRTEVQICALFADA